MPTLFSQGSPETVFDQPQKEQYVREIMDRIIEQLGERPKRVLLLPPDISRFHSDAGNLTQIVYKLLSPEAHIDIMPAVGTHFAMTKEEIREMFGQEIPLSCFHPHDWRKDVQVLGEVSSEKIREISDGAMDYPMEVAVNKILFEGEYDLILSIGQIVPHEVIGMANFTKNVCVGVGGSDMINKSHFLGAVYGVERILGRADNPVRAALNYAFNTYMGDLPVFFIMTVMGKQGDRLVMRGLFCSDKDDQAFQTAAKLSQQVNLDLLDERVDTMVVYLDPSEFRSTWVGNKAVYRTRKVMADGGNLIILAPGLKEFGEDPENDRIIRKYGYFGTPKTMAAVKENEDLQKSLGAAAHLVQGSSEGRFTITYCPGSGVTSEEIESVGFEFADYDTMTGKYNPDQLQEGWNTMDNGEKVFFVRNPALGLWALKEHFDRKDM